MRKPTETQCLELALAQAKECEAEINDLQKMLHTQATEARELRAVIRRLKESVQSAIGKDKDPQEGEAQCSMPTTEPFPSFERWMKEQPMANPSWRDYVNAMAARGVFFE